MSEEEIDPLERLIAAQDMTNIMLWRLYELSLINIRMSDPETATWIKKLHAKGEMITPVPVWPITEEDNEDEGRD